MPSGRRRRASPKVGPGSRRQPSSTSSNCSTWPTGPPATYPCCGSRPGRWAGGGGGAGESQGESEGPQAMTMLEVSGLRVGYGRIQVLFGIDLTVEESEIVTLLGANGAGKSTTLRTISGLLAPKE